MIKEIIKNRFEAGRVFDRRELTFSGFGYSKNFDIRTSPSLLTPVRSYESDESYNGGSIKPATISGLGQVGTSSVYAIGHKIDGTGRKIYNKSVADSEWVATTAGNGSAAESSTGTPVPGFYIEQFNSSGEALHWFLSGSATTPSASTWYLGLNSYATPAVACDFSKKALSLNPLFYPQGILGIDGNVYVSDENKIHKCTNDGTVTDSIFTVSTNFDITSLCLYGQYLAIAIYGQGRSKVLLWDYASAQASESIEWGEGALMVLENVEGQLVGVVDKYINTTLFGSSSGGDGVMQVKVWSGGTPSTINEVKANGVVAEAIKQFKYVKDNTLHWYAKIPLGDGEFEEGIWTVGRKIAGQPLALSLEREIAGTSFEGFWGVGNYLYLPHSGDGSVSRTSSSATYNLTSIYETEVINDGNSHIEKMALGFMVSFEPIEVDQTIVVKYRKNEETDWTTLDPVPVISVDEMAAIYPMSLNFREIEFRIETTGGAKPSGWGFRYETINNALQ